MINRIITQLKILSSNERCLVKWSENDVTAKNIGDALNPFLFEKIFNKKTTNVRESLNTGMIPVYSFIGSVLDNSGVKNLHVLGSGFRNEKSSMPVKPKKVYACRGPLTRKKLNELGVEVPEVYGDPAILLPDYFDLEVMQEKKMGLIPHYVDKELEIVEKYKSDKNVKFIDVFSDMEQFVRDIKSCEFTISSSLHGVIISQAYGIPSVWVKFSEKIGGGNFKFNDYFNSLGMQVSPVILTSKLLSIDVLENEAILPDLSKLKTGLNEAFDKVHL